MDDQGNDFFEPGELPVALRLATWAGWALIGGAVLAGIIASVGSP